MFSNFKKKKNVLEINPHIQKLDQSQYSNLNMKYVGEIYLNIYLYIYIYIFIIIYRYILYYILLLYIDIYILYYIILYYIILYYIILYYIIYIPLWIPTLSCFTQPLCVVSTVFFRCSAPWDSAAMRGNLSAWNATCVPFHCYGILVLIPYVTIRIIGIILFPHLPGEGC